MESSEWYEKGNFWYWANPASWVDALVPKTVIQIVSNLERSPKESFSGGRRRDGERNKVEQRNPFEGVYEMLARKAVRKKPQQAGQPAGEFPHTPYSREKALRVPGEHLDSRYLLECLRIAEKDVEGDGFRIHYRKLAELEGHPGRRRGNDIYVFSEWIEGEPADPGARLLALAHEYAHTMLPHNASEFNVQQVAQAYLSSRFGNRVIEEAAQRLEENMRYIS